MIEWAKEHHGGMWFAGMSTGKTRAALTWAYESDFHNVLVICPQKAGEVWESEIIKTDLPQAWVSVYEGTKQERIRQLQSGSVYAKPFFVIVNYDSFWRKDIWQELLKWPFDAVIFDEAHKLSAPGSRQSRAAHALKFIPNRLAMTGTPMTGSLLKIYGIARAIDDQLFTVNGRRLGTRYEYFESYFSDFIVSGHQHILIDYKNMNVFHEQLNRVAISIKTEDVIDLPDQMHINRYYDLGKKARKIYNDLKKEMIAEWDNNVLVASNILVKSLRLHQITGGFVPDNFTPIDTGKYELLESVLDEIGEQDVVVFARYTAEIKFIREQLSKRDYTTFELSGQRNEIKLWKDSDIPSILVVQIETGAEGIDLTKAHYAIYYSHTFSGTKYQQSLARLRRVNQKNTVTYIHLLTRNTIDEKILNALNEGKKIEDEILEELEVKNYGI